jgi:hypothetical protein
MLGCSVITALIVAYSVVGLQRSTIHCLHEVWCRHSRGTAEEGSKDGSAENIVAVPREMFVCR